MKKITIVIAQENAMQAKQIAEALGDSDLFEVAGIATDGLSAVKTTEITAADICILDLILPGLDGLGVMDRLREDGVESKIVVFSSLVREEIVETAIAKGASYYLTKPCEPKLLVKRLTEIFSEKKTDEPKRTVPSALDERISKIFISVGIPPHIKGYGYLREGIKMAVDNPDIINNITKKLYPMIGEKYDTTPSKVERAIRHAIEVAWARGRIGNINDLFGVQTYLTSEKPTNGEFIALIADKMLLEGA